MPEEKHIHYHVKLWPSSNGLGYMASAACVALVLMFITQCSSNNTASSNARSLEQSRINHEYNCTKKEP